MPPLYDLFWKTEICRTGELRPGPFYIHPLDPIQLTLFNPLMCRVLEMMSQTLSTETSSLSLLCCLNNSTRQMKKPWIEVCRVEARPRIKRSTQYFRDVAAAESPFSSGTFSCNQTRPVLLCCQTSPNQSAAKLLLNFDIPVQSGHRER